MKTKRIRAPKIQPPGKAPVLAGRRERHRLDIRERLFRAALRLFAEKGFQETTVEDITNAADVGKGTFFNYFPQKDHILVAFGEMQLGKLRLLVEEARQSKEPIPRILEKISQGMTEEPGRNPEIVRAILLVNLAGENVRTAMRGIHESARALHQELIAIGQKRGEIRADRSAEEIAHVFRQLVFGTLLMWSLEPEVPLRERIQSAFAIFWKGVQAQTDPARVGAKE
jgi:AcrR family transcriptional regulator